MQDRPIARCQHGHGGPRRDDGHRGTGSDGPPVPVASRRPGQQPAAEHQPGRPVHLHHRAVRDFYQRGPVGAPDPRPGQPVVVQAGVDRLHVPHAAALRGRPRALEGLVVAVAALAARPVPGGQPGGLVEEEQLGQPARRPLRPAPALVLQHADGPGPAAGVAHQPAPGVVQHAPVPPEHPTIGHRDQVSARGHPVLPRHRAPSRLARAGFISLSMNLSPLLHILASYP
jgi:hypothetical protein